MRGGQGLNRRRLLEEQLIKSEPPRRLPAAAEVPFGEAAFLFQPSTESPESQGWTLWVLIAFFPLFAGVPIQTKAGRE